MQHFDILAFHHSLQPFFTSFTFQLSYPSDLFHVYFLTNFTSSTFTFWPLWSIWPLPLSFDHFQNPPSLDKVKGSILTCVIIFQKCLFQAALIFCHSETFIENLRNYMTYCTKAPTGMMMMVKTKWLQFKHKREWIWTLISCPGWLPSTLTGRVAHWASKLSPPRCVCFLLSFYYLLSILIYYDEISGCESPQAFTTQVYSNLMAMCQLSLPETLSMSQS